MKKTIVIIAIIVSILAINKNDSVKIPRTAIRFRIIANSNSIIDQNIKLKVLNNLSNNIKEIEENSNTIDDTRKNIKDKLSLLEQNIKETLKKENLNTQFNIDYGTNYFPKKVYKGITYDEGEYESLIIKLGAAKGKNFWCVLFPPLCLLENEENIEYKSIVKEILNKYF